MGLPVQRWQILKHLKEVVDKNISMLWTSRHSREQRHWNSRSTGTTVLNNTVPRTLVLITNYSSYITNTWLSAAESLVAFSRQADSLLAGQLSTGSFCSHVALAKHTCWSLLLSLWQQLSPPLCRASALCPTQNTAHKTATVAAAALSSWYVQPSTAMIKAAAAVPSNVCQSVTRLPGEYPQLPQQHRGSLLHSSLATSFTPGPLRLFSNSRRVFYPSPCSKSETSLAQSANQNSSCPRDARGGSSLAGATDNQGNLLSPYSFPSQEDEQDLKRPSQCYTNKWKFRKTPYKLKEKNKQKINK